MASVTAVLFIVGPTLADPVTFSDGTFDDDLWVAEKVLDTTPGMSAEFTAGQQPVGGNPGAYRETTHTYAEGGIWVGHLRTDAVYDPSTQGAIHEISHSYDLRLFVGAPYAVRYRLLIFQNGMYFETEGDAIFYGEWQHFEHDGLTESDFTIVDEDYPGDLHPDFSDQGAPMTLGYLTHNYHEGSNEQFRRHGIDNWEVTIRTEPTPVERSTWGRIKALY